MPHLYTKDATQLFYTDEGAGEPFVFVASAWLNSQMWEFQVPYFVDRGFRCVAYDRRGHGRSDWPSAGYDYDTLADDLASVIDHLDLRDVSLVSHSEIPQAFERMSQGGHLGKIVIDLTRQASAV
jgi:non-heme chloroperoxidase